jgi:flagellar hook-basal body complex protein FliE
VTAPFVQPTAALAGVERLLGAAPAAAASPPTGAASFSRILLDGIGSVDRKMAAADAQVRAFALDDSIPVHQVTFALEQARLSLELMLQVRSRLVEGYQQIMGMQL